jgi:hypothetical protein
VLSTAALPPLRMASTTVIGADLMSPSGSKLTGPMTVLRSFVLNSSLVTDALVPCDLAMASMTTSVAAAARTAAGSTGNPGCVALNTAANSRPAAGRSDSRGPVSVSSVRRAAGPDDVPDDRWAFRLAAGDEDDEDNGREQGKAERGEQATSTRTAG